MKLLALLSSIALITVAVAEAENSDPSSSPTPAPISGEMEEPVLPTPDATPADVGAVLLPESDELPANTAVGQPTRVSPNRPKASAAESARFDKVQSMAMSTPRAVYLLKRARNSSRVATRRTYLRAYYSTVAARMRKLDPGLKLSIDEYEEAKVQQVAGSASQSKGSTRRSRSHRTAARVSHHRSRRIAAHHRYERMMILYYPYGPDMPPYGPPMVFDPW